MIDYEKHFFTLLTDWLELKKDHQALRNDFERVCDDLAYAEAAIAEANAAATRIVKTMESQNAKA